LQLNFKFLLINYRSKKKNRQSK